MAQSALLPERSSITRRASGAIPLLLGFLPVLLLGSAQGGYFPSAWGWAALGLLWPAGIALVLKSSLRISRAESAFVLAWLALGAWIAVSLVWSQDLPQTVLEVERVLVYVAGVWAIVVLAETDQARRVLGGALAGITVIALFSLGTRLFPGQLRVYDRSAVYRLAQPLGYWNALAIFSAIGVILALGFAARGRSLAARAISAAILVPLLSTFYFTFGRGGWIALGVGLTVMVLIDPRRLQLLATLLVVAPSCVTAIWLANHSSGLTRAGASAAHAAHDGHRLAVALLLLAGISAGASALVWFVERHVVVPARLRSAFAIVLILALTAGLLATFARYGSPSALARKGYAAFKAPPPHAVNLNQRLLSFSGNGRYDLWRLAWDDAGDHPWLGSGAGTYGRYFLKHQPADVSFVRDAHGLYIETLSELGPFGLALLVIALGVPLVVATRMRGDPIVPAAAGAYTAFLVHAIVDWDWEVPAVMLAGLVCGGSILLIGRRDRSLVELAVPTRVLAVGAAAVVGAFATVGLVGNQALAASDAAREHSDWGRAASEARRARTWLPWSPHALAALGQAQVGAGLVAEGRTTLRRAVSMDPNDWQLWYDLAQASRGPARAHAFRRVLDLYPRTRLVPARLAKATLPTKTP
jgi:O-Antigen ligase